jgi:hypothetical protein
MQDWIKGLIFIILGNIFYDVIPVWTTDYLLSLPNPYYSIGNFLKNLPNLQTSIGNSGSVMGFAGIALIAVGIFFVIKNFYKK